MLRPYSLFCVQGLLLAGARELFLPGSSLRSIAVQTGVLLYSHSGPSFEMDASSCAQSKRLPLYSVVTLRLGWTIWMLGIEAWSFAWKASTFPAVLSPALDIYGKMYL